jgi:hypothetical protein
VGSRPRRCSVNSNPIPKRRPLAMRSIVFFPSTTFTFRRFDSVVSVQGDQGAVVRAPLTEMCCCRARHSDERDVATP